MILLTGGSQTKVEPAFGKKLSEVECVYCGQCSIRCPTGALVVKIRSR